MQTFSFNPPNNLVEEDEWLLAVSSFDCKNCVFNITNENNSFSIIIPCHHQTEFAEKRISDLNNSLEIKFPELLVKEVRKRRNTVKIGDNETMNINYQTLILKQNEILEKLKIV